MNKQILQAELDALKREHAKTQKELEDITRLYEQASALRDLNETEKETQIRYNQMLRDNTPDDILLLDRNLDILLCTSVAKKRFKRDITGENLIAVTREKFSEKYASRVKEECFGLLNNYDASADCKQICELEVETRDEPITFFSVTISPAFDNKGELNGLIVLAHDNTDMHKANIDIEAATRAKSIFLANMSHEIRTPLNAIIGMTNIGKSASEIERMAYCFNKIEDASNHLLGVINDILDMSKIESGKFEIFPAEFDFEKMLQRTINVINFRADEKQQKLTVFIDKNIPKYIYGDDQRLAQVITNLLSNAVKFTPDGGAVTLSAKFLGENDGVCELEIGISDTGIGISDEQQSRLFTSFQQAESNTSRKYGGTGLGLAISKRIVEMMDGKVWIDSELGKGAKFAFTVKVKRADADKKKEFIPDWSGARILVVDDDPVILEFFKETIEAYGAKCDIAANGDDALKLREENGPYDIYFIDYIMPGLNGVELTRILKEKDGDKTYAALITGAERSEFEEETAGALININKILFKPVFPSEIIDLINGFWGIDPHKSEETNEKLIDRFDGFNILLAEDVEVNREIVLALLEPAMLKIDCAENGAEAVRIFSENPNKYDIIFMDVQMPEMDGYAATRFIRALEFPKAQSIPIIAMTANVFREDVEKCIKAGMNGHIGKPLDFDEVLAQLRIYLS